MNRRILLLIAILCAHPALGAITLNQAPTRVTLNHSSTTNTITFGSTMTNPSLIVVMVTIESSTATISSVADNKNTGNYNQDVSMTTSGTSVGDGTVAIFSMQNTQIAAATITLTLSTGAYGTIWAAELTGAATSSAFDQSATQSIMTGGGSVSLALSGMQATDAVLASILWKPSVSCSTYTNYDSGFTTTGSNVTAFNSCHYGEYNVDYAAGGSLTLTFGGASTANAMAGAAAAYKAAGAGPTVPPSQMFLGSLPQPHTDLAAERYRELGLKTRYENFKSPEFHHRESPDSPRAEALVGAARWQIEPRYPAVGDIDPALLQVLESAMPKRTEGERVAVLR